MCPRCGERLAKDLSCTSCGDKYLKRPDNILDFDVFATLDQAGVGQLIEIALAKGRAARPNLKTGICGEHGGDPQTVEFCHRTGLEYVSCSPYRVPVARLAAAQAALKEKEAVRARAGKKKK